MRRDPTAATRILDVAAQLAQAATDRRRWMVWRRHNGAFALHKLEFVEHQATIMITRLIPLDGAGGGATAI